MKKIDENQIPPAAAWPSPPVLATLTRGQGVECLHRGWMAAVGSDGRSLLPPAPLPPYVFTRSMLKPFQALPLVMGGALGAYGLTEAELAVACSSHSGQDFHLQAVRSILARSGCREEDLRCGSHEPMHAETAAQLSRQGLAPTPLHNNCSGKHAGMLAAARFHGWNLATYLEPEHPLQQAIRQGLADLTSLAPDQWPAGIDGCSAPNYALPLPALARLYALLARPGEAPFPYRPALTRIRAALLQYPEYIAGSQRFDTELMRRVPGLIAKCGALGGMAVADCDRGAGLVIKIEDGNKTAIPSITVEALRQLGWITPAQHASLADWHDVRLFNHQGTEVGRLQPVFTL